MKNSKIIALTILLLVLTVSGCLPASAGGVWTWQGAGNANPVIYTEDTPVIMESQRVTFDIPSFPMGEFKEGNEAYSASVTAEYQLYNPTEEEITVEAWLPVWDRGTYYEEWDMEKLPEAPYTLTAGEEVLPYTIRYIAITGNYPVTSLDSLGRGSVSFLQDDFFTPELKVTVYTFPIGANDRGWKEDQLRYVGFVLPEITENAKVAIPQMMYYGSVYDEEGRETMLPATEEWGWDAEEEAPVLQVYFLGEAPTEAPCLRIFQSWNDWHAYFDDELPADIFVGEYTVEETTLLELTETLRPQEPEIDQVDWYNAMVSKMCWDEERNPQGILTLDESYLPWWDPEIDEATPDRELMEFYFNEYGRYRGDRSLSGNLMSCYVYSLTIGAGERLTHTIQAPLDPGIYYSFEIPTYKYLYLFSTAESWGGVGTTEIVVNTPYEMTWSNLNRFVPGEGTYTMTTTGNLETDLYFELEKRYELPPNEIEVSGQVAEIVEKKTWKPWIFACGMFLAACPTAGLLVHFQLKKIKKS